MKAQSQANLCEGSENILIVNYCTQLRNIFVIIVLKTCLHASFFRHNEGCKGRWGEGE